MAGSSGPHVPAYDQLAARIRAQILSGELSPGDQLPTETELSSAYQVGRNTAREALRALASQGLLTTKRGVSGGTFVATPSAEQFSGSLHTGFALLVDSAHLPVTALLEVREMVEVPAAELAALRRTDAELDFIRETLFDPETVNPDEVFASNRDFHGRILNATHNPLLKVVVQPVFRILKERFLRQYAPAEFWYQVDSDHREILNHLEERDQAGARESARAHLRYLRRTYGQIDRYLRARDDSEATRTEDTTAQNSEL